MHQNLLKYEECTTSSNNQSNCHIEYSNLLGHHNPSFTTEAVATWIYFPLSRCMRHSVRGRNARCYWDFLKQNFQ